MEKIKALTKAQKARFPEFVKKWIDIGLSTERADRPTTERAIKNIYAQAKLKEPKVVWLPCPISGAISAVVFAKLANIVAVRDAVRDTVYDTVDAAVHDAVRYAVYDAVSAAVGETVHAAVRDTVRAAGYSFWAGSMWTAYPAWADYFSKVCNVKIDRAYLEYVQSCGYAWVLNGVVFACERPTAIHRDDQGRLHCEYGQAVEFESGWGLSVWHGVTVPRYVIESPESIKAEHVLSEKNAEVRRVMMERMDREKFFTESSAKKLSTDDFGTLYSLPGDDDVTPDMVKVVNSTPEHDGSFRDYLLFVPRGLKTAKAAVAWTFRKDEKQYAPVAES